MLFYTLHKHEAREHYVHFVCKRKKGSASLISVNVALFFFLSKDRYHFEMNCNIQMGRTAS